MRALLPLTLLLAAAPARAADAAGAALAAACAPSVLPAEDAACAGRPLCSARDRVKLACDAGEALARRYVFFPTKRASDGVPVASRSPLAAPAPPANPDASRFLPPGAVGRDPSAGRPLDVHLAACVEAERAVAREDEPLRFYDRLRACTAALDDGHVVVGAPKGLPSVALGIGLRRVGGRVVVASRDEPLLRELERAPGGAGLREAVAIGAEVLAVDGRPVEEALADLARFVPGSSPAARLERAVDALTRRDFLLPERREATLTLASAGERRTVRLRWWLSPGGRSSAMGRAWADRLGLATSELVSWADPRDRAERRAAEGTLRTDPILPPRDAAALRELAGDGGRVAVRLGEVARRGDRAFCYLQVLSFHTDTLGAGGERRRFGEALDAFVRGCKEKRLDLVVDLRHNEGGYLANASALVAAVLPEGGVAPGGALVVRDTDRARAIYEERARRGRWPSDGPEPSRVLRALERARREGADFTPAFFEPPVHASARVGGYDGRVVALVSPTCMSACDRAAAMLRATGRAVLVGEPTEGAGGSQQEVPGAIGTRWRDEAGLVSLAIPNAAMGVPRSAPGAAPEVDAEAFFRGLALENHPVEPDVPYAPGLEDVTEHGRGWLAAVESALFPPEAAPVAAGPAAVPPASRPAHPDPTGAARGAAGTLGERAAP